MYLHRASWHSSVTLTEGFPRFFLSCKANARVNPAKMGARHTLFQSVVLFCVLFVLCRSVYCLCVNVYCTTAPGGYPTAINRYIVRSYYYGHQAEVAQY